MTAIKKIIGNYQHVFSQSHCPVDFVQASITDNYYEQALKAIFVDLLRSKFLVTADKTFDDLITIWTESNVSTAYAQGNIDAAVFEMVIKSWIPYLKNTELQQRYFSKENMVSIRFAYFDDTGIPCGVMIYGPRFDPDTWTATIIRNTTAAPDERDVMLLSSANLLRKKAVTNNHNSPTFDDFLKSEEVRAKLKNVFLENNQLNIAKIDSLSEELITITPEQQAILAKKMEQLSTLGDRYWPQTAKKDYQCQLEKLDKRLQQLGGDKPVIRRQAVNLFGTGVAMIAVVGLLLMVTGALAPWGLLLAASMVTYGLIASVVCSIIAVGFLFNTIRSERSVFAAQQEKASYHAKLASLAADFKPMICHIMTNDLNDEQFEDYCTPKHLNAKQSHSEGRLVNTQELTASPDYHNTPPASPRDHQHGLGLFDDTSLDEVINTAPNNLSKKNH